MEPSEPGQVQFGLMLPMTSRHLDTGELLAELTAEVVAAEASGFDLCLVPEHHGGPPTALTDPMATVAWLLARTHRIQVGTGVLLLPLHSLPRLAEQAAVLQHASGGRLVVGVGAGYQPADFATFGVDRATRGAAVAAGVDALRNAWRTGEMDGHPIHPTLDGVDPPPVLIGAWSTQGIRRAATQADGWIADPIRTVAATAKLAQEYRALARTAGRPDRVVVIREAWLDDSDDLAAATFGPVIEPIFRYYLRNGAFEPNHGLSDADIQVRAALADRVLCGSAATMADRITDVVRRTGAQTVVLGLRHPGGPEHEKVLTAISRLGEEVLPIVREQVSGKSVGRS